MTGPPGVVWDAVGKETMGREVVGTDGTDVLLVRVVEGVDEVVVVVLALEVVVVVEVEVEVVVGTEVVDESLVVVLNRRQSAISSYLRAARTFGQLLRGCPPVSNAIPRIARQRYSLDMMDEVINECQDPPNERKQALAEVRNSAGDEGKRLKRLSIMSAEPGKAQDPATYTKELLLLLELPVMDTSIVRHYMFFVHSTQSSQAQTSPALAAYTRFQAEPKSRVPAKKYS